ncbi:MAG: pilus assembly protein PilM [Aquificaceae bacterium]
MRLTLPKISLPSFKKTKASLAVQINDEVLRILELSDEKKPVFEPVEVLWGEMDEKQKVDILKSYVGKYNLRDKEVISCIPANDGLLKLYKYPATMSSKDLQHAIDWAIKRELSMFKEATVYDYFILERSKEDKNVVVLLTLAKEDSINKVRRFLEPAGIRLSILDYEVTSIINYGLYSKLSVPFVILYIDYYYSVLVSYSHTNVVYFTVPWSYRESTDEGSLEEFLAEVRNIVVINDLSSLCLAGPILAEEKLLTRILETLPILTLLDLGAVKANFFIPYILSIRGMQG